MIILQLLVPEICTESHSSIHMFWFPNAVQIQTHGSVKLTRAWSEVCQVWCYLSTGKEKVCSRVSVQRLVLAENFELDPPLKNSFTGCNYHLCSNRILCLCEPVLMLYGNWLSWLRNNHLGGGRGGRKAIHFHPH